MSKKFISASFLKKWQASKLIYRTATYNEYGFKFLDIDIREPNGFSSMTIRFQMNNSAATLFSCYGAKITDLTMNRADQFLGVIKDLSHIGFCSNSLRRALRVLNKRGIIRATYISDSGRFIPYKYRKESAAFMAASDAIKFN